MQSKVMKYFIGRETDSDINDLEYVTGLKENGAGVEWNKKSKHGPEPIEFDTVSEAKDWYNVFIQPTKLDKEKFYYYLVAVIDKNRWMFGNMN